MPNDHRTKGKDCDKTVSSSTVKPADTLEPEAIGLPDYLHHQGLLVLTLVKEPVVLRAHKVHGGGQLDLLHGRARLSLPHSLYNLLSLGP